MRWFPRLLAPLIFVLAGAVAWGQPVPPPALSRSSNLADVPNKSAGLTNLGLRYASNRAPLPTDDTAHGNLPTSLWLNPLDGQVYNMVDGTANNASWTKMIVPATPGDAGGTPLASYGVCRVVGAYTGNLFTLTRTSDSTTLTAPQGVDTCVNPAPLDAFCANTTCFVSTLNDQSGNGFDCVGVAATGPQWMPNAAINGRRAIRWAAIPHTLLSQTATFKFCTAAGVTTWNPGAYSFVFAGQFAMTSAGPSTLFTDSTSGFGWASSGNVNQRVAIVYGTGATLGVAIPATPVVVGYTAANGAGGNKLSVNNDYAAVFGSVIAAKTGLIVGGSAAYQRMDMLSLTLYATPLTAPQMLNVRASAAAQFKIPPQCCDVVVSVHGDSLLTGDGALTGVPLPTRAVAMQNIPVKLYNFTVFGNVLLGAAPSILAAAAQDLNLVLEPEREAVSGGHRGRRQRYPFGNSGARADFRHPGVDLHAPVGASEHEDHADDHAVANHDPRQPDLPGATATTERHRDRQL